MRSPLEAFRRRVGALDGAIPPLGGVGPWAGALLLPTCIPVGRQAPTDDGFRWMGLRFGGFIVSCGVLCARGPLSMRVNPLMRTLTLEYARGRRCPRADHRVNVRVIGPTCIQAGLNADSRISYSGGRTRTRQSAWHRPHLLSSGSSHCPLDRELESLAIHSRADDLQLL